jgi:YbbR domain-containing protein
MGKTTWTTRLSHSRIAWAILSLVSALVIWLFVNSTELTTETPVFSGVKVVFAGEERLNELGLTITNIQNPEVTVRLSGPRSEMQKLNSGNISVKIQISSDVTEPNNMRINAETVVYPSDVNYSKIDVLSITPNTIVFKIDTLVTKEIPVQGEFTGTFAEGFMQDGEITFDPDTVEIKGPEKLLNTIDHALVTIDRANVEETITADSAYVAYALYDKYDDPIETDEVTFETTTVATLPVTAFKRIPLVVKTIDGGGAVYPDDVRITINPASVEISGDKKLLDEIKSIELGSVNLADFPLTGEWTFPIPVGTGLTNRAAVSSATVKAEIIGMETAVFSVSNISLINAPYGYTAQCLADSADVLVRAAPEELAKISSQGIRIVADLSELTSVQTSPGVVTVTAKVYIDGIKKAGAIGAVTLQISLSKT